LAAQLAKTRRDVLLISTDPAHNLSDAFGQKFSKEETKVDGFTNLFAMEIDPHVEVDVDDPALDSNTKSFVSEMASSIPGIDEAMSFAELMKQVQSMNHDVIVFDTAPTGHTLRLLAFPSLLEKAFAKLMTVKNKFDGIFRQVAGAMPANTEEKVLQRFDQLKTAVETIHKNFKNPEVTTFICVCIPEFLSLFETERLVQELTKFEIDTHNIVVNQVLMPEADSHCRKCLARVNMQRKYLDQIDDLYGPDFHVVKMPLLDDEVRGVEALQAFSEYLLHPVQMAAAAPLQQQQQQKAVAPTKK